MQDYRISLDSAQDIPWYCTKPWTLQTIDKTRSNETRYWTQYHCVKATFSSDPERHPNVFLTGGLLGAFVKCFILKWPGDIRNTHVPSSYCFPGHLPRAYNGDVQVPVRTSGERRRARVWRSPVGPPRDGATHRGAAGTGTGRGTGCGRRGGHPSLHRQDL